MNEQPNIPTPTITEDQRAKLFELIRHAAQTEIMPRFRNLEAGQIDTKTGPTDLVTEADVSAEQVITLGLKSAFPNAVIVGEESVASMPDYHARLAEAELGFVLDPVDGTWNFAHGVPAFGTMLAATHYGRPIFGVIYDPVGDDLIWADADTAAIWQPRTAAPRALATRDTKSLDQIEGFIEPVFMTPPHREITAKACLSLSQIGSMRCAAYQYRLIAQGAVDFMLATKLTPWDHAAGPLICQQAGGHVAMLDGTPYNASIETGYLLTAGSRETWDLLAAHFRDLLN